MTNVANDLEDTLFAMGKAARLAARELAGMTNDERDRLLRAIADELRQSTDEILAANALDVRAAKANGLSAAKLDRLQLDGVRLQAMAASVDAVADFPSVIGQTLSQTERPNGLVIQKVSVPLGVIGIIYESRPNVTIDAAALCLKSGNAVLLRGGSESFASNHAIYDVILKTLQAEGIRPAAVQLIPTRSRDAVGIMLTSMGSWLDVVVPRGGRSLVARVQRDARVPVIGHLEGLCHVFVHASADIAMARDIVLNSKMRRTGICGAAETILIDQQCDSEVLTAIADDLNKAGCAIRGDEAVCNRVRFATRATDEDWRTEYLDAIVAIRMVDGIDAAMSHIEANGSGHTDSIVCSDDVVANRFLSSVDSAIVLHNASTQFADGGEFGMGAEIGIATGRIHARGPVGAEQLTSYKYAVRGDGQVRES